MVQVIGLVIAAIAAYFVYQDAVKRGMNGIGWAIGTFLLLIIFLPLYFIMRKPLLTDSTGMGPGAGMGPGTGIGSGTNPPGTL